MSEATASLELSDSKRVAERSGRLEARSCGQVFGKAITVDVMITTFLADVAEDSLHAATLFELPRIGNDPCRHAFHICGVRGGSTRCCGSGPKFGDNPLRDCRGGRTVCLENAEKHLPRVDGLSSGDRRGAAKHAGDGLARYAGRGLATQQALRAADVARAFSKLFAKTPSGRAERKKARERKKTRKKEKVEVERQNINHHQNHSSSHVHDKNSIINCGPN